MKSCGETGDTCHFLQSKSLRTLTAGCAPNRNKGFTTGFSSTDATAPRQSRQQSLGEASTTCAANAHRRVSSCPADVAHYVRQAFRDRVALAVFRNAENVFEDMDVDTASKAESLLVAMRTVLPQKADIKSGMARVRFVPKADKASGCAAKQSEPSVMNAADDEPMAYSRTQTRSAKIVDLKITPCDGFAADLPSLLR